MVVAKEGGTEREALLHRRRAALEEMRRLREKAVEAGMKPLTEERILREIARRRGEIE
ncbi:hypothetical protein BH11ARM2_BH11ARM2_10880 [soil metagenome]